MSNKKNSMLIRILVIVILAAAIGTWFGLKEKSIGYKIDNVVLISIDTCRADYLSCYGYKQKTTPNIDQIAENGTLFENAVSPVPITLPAHSSMMTGAIPPHHGVHNNMDFKLAGSNFTLAEILKQKGFKTAAFISAFVLDSKFGMDQGFDEYYDDFDQRIENVFGSERTGRETTYHAVNWLQQNSSGNFFLFLHYYDPHWQYTPPEPYADKYPDCPYAGEIAFTDHCIGQVIDKLKELGLYDSSLIIIAGDHGEMLGEHGEQEHTYFIYQAAIKVPLIIKLPGQDKNSRITDTVGLVDIVPTVCGLLDIKIPVKIQGTDLSGYLNQQQVSRQERYYYCESLIPARFMANSLLGIVDNRYKYIQTTRPELYDLQKDPAETNNLIAAESARARIMQDKLKTIMDNAVRPKDSDTEIELDEQDLARLQSLGYVAGRISADTFEFDQSREDPKDLIDIHVAFQEASFLTYEAKYEQAKKIYLDLLETRPDIFKIYLHLGSIAKLQNEFELAEEYFYKALEIKSDIQEAYESIASIMTSQGQMQGAIENYRKALEIGPEKSSIHNNLGTLLFEAGRLTEAEQHYRQALQIEPHKIDTRNNLALVLTGLKKMDEAVEQYYKILDADPQNAMAHSRVGSILIEKGDIDEGIKHYKQSISTEPDQLRILNDLAWLGSTRDNDWFDSPEELINTAKRVCELTEYKEANALDTLAAAYAAAGKYADAVKTAEKGIQLAISANQQIVASELAKHLAAYKDQKPWRE